MPVDRQKFIALRLKRLFDSGELNDEQIELALERDWITEEQAKEIKDQNKVNQRKKQRA